MESGDKHEKIVAEIKDPLDMVVDCVERQGKVAFFERSFAIDDAIQNWLIDNVLDDGDANLVTPVKEQQFIEDMGPRLPAWEGHEADGEIVRLPSQLTTLADEQVAEAIRKYNFFDLEINSHGKFLNRLYESGRQTIVDERTGLMWQRSGLDIASFRTLSRNIEKLNKKGFAGHHDWRLPTLEEAMSLMEAEANDKGIHLDPNFSREQPFIFVAAQRTPSGYWFVDYKQGRSFWSSGTIPGGFGRLCRTV